MEVGGRSRPRDPPTSNLPPLTRPRLLPATISLSRSRLRPWRLEDRDSLVEHIDDVEVARNLRRVPNPYTGADADEWLRFAADDPPPPGIYAIDVGGKAVGTIALDRGVDVGSRSFEIGYWLGRKHWGRGIMSEAVVAVTNAAFAEPETIRVFAPVFAWNRTSMRVLEKAGYVREAVLVRAGYRDGTVFDRIVFAITRDVGLPYVRFVDDG